MTPHLQWRTKRKPDTGSPVVADNTSHQGASPLSGEPVRASSRGRIPLKPTSADQQALDRTAAVCGERSCYRGNGCLFSDHQNCK